MKWRNAPDITTTHRALRAGRNLCQRTWFTLAMAGRYLPVGSLQLRRARAMEVDRGDQYLHYDFWWHLLYDTF